jgi:hypothetical protein
VLGPGPLYVGCPSSDAITSHLAAASGAEVRNDVKVRGALWGKVTCTVHCCISYFLPLLLPLLLFMSQYRRPRRSTPPQLTIGCCVHCGVTQHCKAASSSSLVCLRTQVAKAAYDAATHKWLPASVLASDVTHVLAFVCTRGQGSVRCHHSSVLLEGAV